MLDIHLKWLIVLLINFLVLIFLLNKILFQPLLALFKQRQDTVKDSLAAAQAMNQKREDGIATMTREISAARRQAKEAFEGFRNEGVLAQKSLLANAEADAAAMLQKAREEIRAESDRARQKLKSDVEKFSDEIVRKLVNA
ncbi:MAG: hypothetical protein OHK006_05360 [Thermodesulfovibrionales bacterium]